MIRRLDLTDYGKFRKERLHFGPFTVITGANEAGKTTVFDALFDALCAGSRHEGRPAWKALAGRYGALRKAELVWEEGFHPLSFTDDEFLEIFAVRAGDTRVDAEGGGSWEGAAEARLLNSGLNPASFAAGMEDKADSARKGSLKYREKELNRQINAREPELQELKVRRAAIFAGEAETARLEAELKRLREAQEARLAELEALKEREEELSLSCRLASAEAGLKALRELKDTRGELARLVVFASNELPAYRALRSAADEAGRAYETAAAALAEKEAYEASAKAVLDQLEIQQPVIRKRRATAEALNGRISAFLAAPPKVLRSVSKGARFGLWAGALALAGFVVYSGRNNVSYATAAVIAAAGAWVGVKLSIKETLAGPSPEEIKAFLAGLMTEWVLVSEEKLPSDGVENARAFLSRAMAAAADAEADLKVRSEALRDLRAASGTVRTGVEELRAAAAGAAGKAQAWLKERGCDSEDDYQGKLAAHGRFVQRAGDIMQRVKIFKDRLRCSGDDEIRDRLLMEKEALDHKGVDPSKADEPELERLKARAAELNEDVHSVAAAASEVNSALEKARAVAGARLEGLPERINRLEAENASDREELAGLELQKQAYRLAADVFRKLAEESTAAFAELGKEVTAMLSRAVPELKAQFISFKAGEAGMKDAGGAVRPVKYLSSGARDLFMLAARLTMAEDCRRDADGNISPALLVLDDPFYTLDSARTRAALKLLADFQKETGWQIIILTKDFTLPDAAREATSQITEQTLI